MRHLPHYFAVPVMAALAVPYTVSPVYATEYLSVQQAQQLMFPDADAFAEAPVTLTEVQREKIKSLAGVRQRQQVQPAWQATSQGKLLGWFFVDDVIGKHDYITYATAISPEGKVLAVEILQYRETHGGQVRKQEWLQHFAGKTVQDKFKLNQDIPNISGATLSCRNVTDGVKRLLVLHKTVLAQ